MSRYHEKKKAMLGFVSLTRSAIALDNQDSLLYLRGMLEGA
jgi:hypothetical protein